MKNVQILVVSDSHGESDRLWELCERHPEIDTVCHLGDGMREAEDMAAVYPHRRFFWVAGNCDFAMMSPPLMREECVAGKRLFLTHGHLFGVKGDLTRLAEAGLARGVEAVLFGHTHRPFEEWRNGMLLFNPGSLKNGDYGILNLSEEGIYPRHHNI